MTSKFHQRMQCAVATVLGPLDCQFEYCLTYSPQYVMHSFLNIRIYKIHQIHLLSGFVFDSGNNWKWGMAPQSQPSSLGRVRLLFTTLTVALWVMYVLTLCNILSGSCCIGIMLFFNWTMSNIVVPKNRCYYKLWTHFVCIGECEDEHFVSTNGRPDVKRPSAPAVRDEWTGYSLIDSPIIVTESF